MVVSNNEEQIKSSAEKTTESTKACQSHIHKNATDAEKQVHNNGSKAPTKHITCKLT